MWGCSDAENFMNSDIGPLLKMHQADKRWGALKWCMIHRNMQPQAPVAQDMKTNGAWDETMDALPLNSWENPRKKEG